VLECVTCRRKIGRQDRRLLVVLHVRWGDWRAPWSPSGEPSFCSFGCAELWLGTLASEHDGIFLADPAPVTVEATN
jgi:hypothetical protein